MRGHRLLRGHQDMLLRESETIAHTQTRKDTCSEKVWQFLGLPARLVGESLQEAKP
jgi:hypothetical protein